MALRNAGITGKKVLGNSFRPDYQTFRKSITGKSFKALVWQYLRQEGHSSKDTEKETRIRNLEMGSRLLDVAFLLLLASAADSGSSSWIPFCGCPFW